MNVWFGTLLLYLFRSGNAVYVIDDTKREKNLPIPDQLHLTTSLLIRQEQLLLLPKIFEIPHSAPQPNIPRALDNTQLPHPKSLSQPQWRNGSILLESQANLLGN